MFGSGIWWKFFVDVYSKSKTKKVIIIKQVYNNEGCNVLDKENSDSDLTPYHFTMFNDFDLYNVYAEIAEIKSGPF